MVFNVLLVCLCRYYAARKLRTKINQDVDDRIATAVTSYLALKDNK